MSSEREDPKGKGFEAGLTGCGVRTFLVFLDLPKHFEFMAGSFPVLDSGTELDLDLMVRDPSDPRKSRAVKGLYFIKRRVLRYSNGRASRAGLSQYLEVEPSKGDAPP